MERISCIVEVCESRKKLRQQSRELKQTGEEKWRWPGRTGNFYLLFSW